MSTVLIGVPVIKDSRKFHLEKGRRWTVVEHILLEALAKEDWTIGDLQAASALPRRVVIEVVIRLMRAGWVELRTSSTGVIFAATARGRAYATLEELPPVTRPASRYAGYVVDLFAGSVFRAREVVTVKESQWASRSAGRSSALLPARLGLGQALPDIQVLADKLLESDEHLIRVEVRDWRPQTRLAVVAVRDGVIEGLGGEIPDPLKDAIKVAAKGAEQNTSPVYPAISTAFPSLHRRPQQERRISFKHDDLILGGPAHEQALRAMLTRARYRIVVHSTFMNAARAEDVLELMRPAVQKGAIVDILWGQAKEKNKVNETREAANQLRALLARQGLQDRVRVHSSSTRSHAKIVLADAGEPDRFSGLIGSCNWLSSDFKSFDASVRLRDAAIVSDLVYDLAELARPRDGQIPMLSTEMVRLGRFLQESSRTPSSRSTARIVTGPEHAEILRDARDNADRSVLMLSHRLDTAAKPNLSAMAATGRGKQLEAYYGRLGDKVQESSAANLVVWAIEHGVRLELARTKLHAKVLAWDDDNVLITSLNVLSADPQDHEPRQELGVLLRAPEAAKLVTKAFEQANSVRISEGSAGV